MEDNSQNKKAISSEDRKARRRRLTERLETLRERARLLELELSEFTNDFFRVCIFGSARIKNDDDIYKTTQTLARYLGEMGIDVLTGGGPGLMEAANLGVKEGRGVSGSKSKSFGISIDLPQIREPLNDHLDIKHHHKKFSSRLDDFMRLSNVVVVNPGGIGTLLELFFSWQLLQVGHLPDRPIVLLGGDFWSGLVDWMKKYQIGRGLVSPGDIRWINIVDSPEAAMSVIVKEYQKFNEKRLR
jgi:uncharacterized protein (TIGR00730 family)